jgi:hypothetical protein
MMRIPGPLLAGLMMASLGAPSAVNAAQQGPTFVAHTATIDGTRIYYRTSGAISPKPSQLLIETTGPSARR